MSAKLYWLAFVAVGIGFTIRRIDTFGVFWGLICSIFVLSALHFSAKTYFNK